MNKTRGLIAALLAFVLCQCLTVARAETPHAVIERIGDAIDAGDAETLQTLIDLDAVLTSVLATVIAESATPENKKALPAAVAMIFTQAADDGLKGQTLRGLIVAEAKAFALNGVKTGAFAGKKLKAAPDAGILAPLFSGVSMGRKEIRGVGDGLREGDDWIIPFWLHDYGNDQDYAVLGRFSPNGESWKLVAVENTPRLFEQLLKEAAAR